MKKELEFVNVLKKNIFLCLSCVMILFYLVGFLDVYAASTTCPKCNTIYNSSTDIQAGGCLVCQMNSEGDLHIVQEGSEKCTCDHSQVNEKGEPICVPKGASCSYCVHFYSSDIDYLASELNALFAEIPTDDEIATMAASSTSTYSLRPTMSTLVYVVCQ